MLTIQKLLDKIQWDKNLDKEEFSIGYKEDNEIIKVPITEITREKENKFSFYTEDKEIPYHRIKKVWKNNKLIWERKDKEEKKLSDLKGKWKMTNKEVKEFIEDLRKSWKKK